jgi:peptidylprolyl isomerase
MVVEGTTTEEAATEEPTTAEAEGTPEAAVEPDSNAPADVAAPPEDAKRTESGLAWKRLGQGKGKKSPSGFDTVTVNYTGWTSEGQRFDSSESRGEPLTIPLHHMLPGVAEGLQMMVPGEERRLWIPGKLAYGEAGSDVQTAPKQPLGDLVFDIELVSFEEAPAAPPPPKDVAAIPSDAEKSESGLAWRVLKKGVGSEHPKQTSVVDMVYTVWNTQGEAVEGTFLRGGVDTVGISRLVPGWNEGMKLMVEGERRIFWIPEELAFAGRSHRPSGMLVVDVTLVQIRRDLHQVN